MLWVMELAEFNKCQQFSVQNFVGIFKDNPHDHLGALSLMSLSPLLSRRTLAKGAAWSTPVVLAGAAVPAYAASVIDPTYTVKSGAFVQVVNTDTTSPYLTTLGVSSYDGGSTSPDGKAPVGNAVVTADGDFTPGGTIAGSAPYGGAGFWVSTPISEQGGEFVAGSVVLPMNTSFTMTYTVTFEDADYSYEPLMWVPGKVEKVAGNATAGNTTNRNDVPFTATFGEGAIAGSTWTGTVTYTTTQDVELFYSADDSYIQVLASHVPVYYDVAEGIVSFQAKIAVAAFSPVITVNGTTEVETVEAKEQTAALVLNPSVG